MTDQAANQILIPLDMGLQGVINKFFYLMKITSRSGHVNPREAGSVSSKLC